MEVIRLGHKGVAFPPADGVAMPIRHHCSLTRKRTAVHVDRAETVIRLRYVKNLSRRLDDLKWLGIDVVLKRTLGQAQPIRIIQAILCGTHLLELGRPRLEWQPFFESRSRVAAPHQWRPAGGCAVRLGIIKSSPDSRQIGLPVGCSRRRCVEIRLAVRAFRNSWLRI